MTKVGRPSKYALIESRLDEVKKLAICGLTDEEIAKFFGVSRSNFSEYKKKHPEFQDILKNSKRFADTEVIYSLYKRAKGFDYEEIMQEGKQDTDGKLKVTTVKKTKKHYPPDVTACIYWLRNRQGWIDRVDTTKEDTPEPPEFENMSDEQLDNYIKNGNGK